MAKKKIEYPAFVKSDEDKAAYRIGYDGGWHQFIKSRTDILAVTRQGCYFDLEAAQDVEGFFLLLRHTTGEFEGQPFVLPPWQRDGIIYPLFGWKKASGLRRFSKALIMLGKKNGKTTLGSGIALYMLMGDDESGSEVYNAAVDSKQSAILMRGAIQMVEKSPFLKAKLQPIPNRNRIVYPAKASFCQALSSEAGSADGINPHCIIFDEIHQWPDRKLWDILQGGAIARRQPLLLSITTAGQDRQTFAYAEYLYGKKVIAGGTDDTSYFAFIAEADPKDDPGLESTWRKANPGLGTSPRLDKLQELWLKAKDSPEDRNRFLRYHLGIWTEKVNQAIPGEVWDRGGEIFDPAELNERDCVGGLDLGTVSDLTCLLLLFPEPDESFKALLYVWVPEDRANDRDNGKVSYLQWEEDGFMMATPGNIMDHHRVRRDINSLSRKFNIQAIAVDTQFQGKQLASEMLNEDNLPIIDYRNNVGSMAEPTRTFMELVLAGKLKHGSNPVYKWASGNLVLKTDHQGNMIPSKAASADKIDPIIGTVMALGVRNVAPKTTKSYYEDHELLVLG